MRRNSLQNLPATTTNRLAHAAGREINDRLKKPGWMQRVHWAWLWTIIAGSWVADFIVNTLFHLATIFGHALDSLLGPIDEALIAILPFYAARELWRRGMQHLESRKATQAQQDAQVEADQTTTNQASQA